MVQLVWFRILVLLEIRNRIRVNFSRIHRPVLMSHGNISIMYTFVSKKQFEQTN